MKPGHLQEPRNQLLLSRRLGPPRPLGGDQKSPSVDRTLDILICIQEKGLLLPLLCEGRRLGIWGRQPVCVYPEVGDAEPRPSRPLSGFGNAWTFPHGAVGTIARVEWLEAETALVPTVKRKMYRGPHLRWGTVPL